MVKGHTSYKGYTAQQHENFYSVIKNFLEKIKPSRILEIGTAGGGFILAVRDILNEIGLSETPIITYDVIENEHYNKLRELNIQINIENLFNHPYTELVKPEKIVPYIQSDGVTVVFCDGGHKIGEFNSIASYIKNGDYILAHDYIDTWENFESNYKGKIWDWCEIEEKYINDVSTRECLNFYMKDEFDKIVWVCKIKGECQN
jgi:cephalosporin hydroxylase